MRQALVIVSIVLAAIVSMVSVFGFNIPYEPVQHGIKCTLGMIFNQQYDDCLN